MCVKVAQTNFNLQDIHGVGTYDTPPKLIILLGGDIIEQVSSVKTLGVHIDKNLSWNIHIEKMAKKIASGIGAIKRCRPFVN